MKPLAELHKLQRTIEFETGWPILVDNLLGEINQRDIEIERLQAALTSIKGFGDVDLAGEYEHGLRDIIRSMTDCAKNALNQQLTMQEK